MAASTNNNMYNPELELARLKHELGKEARLLSYLPMQQAKFIDQDENKSAFHLFLEYGPAKNDPGAKVLFYQKPVALPGGEPHIYCHMYKGNVWVKQLSVQDVRHEATAGEAFEHVSAHKQLAVARYYFMQKGVDFQFSFAFHDTFKDELIGACKEIKAAKDAASELALVQIKRRHRPIMKTQAFRESIHYKSNGLSRNTKLESLLFPPGELTDGINSKDKIITEALTTSNADKDSQDSAQRASKIPVPGQDSKPTVQRTSTEPQGSVTSATPGIVLNSTAADTTSVATPVDTTANANTGSSQPTTVLSFQEYYYSMFMKETSLNNQVTKVKEERVAVWAKMEHLKSQDMALGQKELAIVEEKTATGNTLKRMRSTLSHDDLYQFALSFGVELGKKMKEGPQQ